MVKKTVLESKTLTFHESFGSGRRKAARQGIASIRPEHSHPWHPKPPHTTGSLIRGGARREGGSGLRRAAQDADGMVRPGDNRPLFPPDDARITFWSCLWNYEQMEQNPRLTRGSSAVYQRDKKRSSFLAADQFPDAYFSLYTFFMQGMSGI